MRKIKDAYPHANIVALDFDPGATSVNQENRLKLMLDNARLNNAFTVSSPKDVIHKEPVHERR